MISKWRWLLLQISRKLWVRVSLFAVLAVATALVAILVARLIPGGLPGKIGANAVDRILDILASSMLAVTTFSLGVMVSAYSAATSNVTPRATRLLMQDSATQNMLGTFIGTFLYSLVGIIALSAGAYGEEGRAVLFLVTLGVIVVVVGTLLRWIEHLSKLGRVGETTDRVEEAALAAVEARLKQPNLGGRLLKDLANGIPATATPIYPTKIGYVQHIDLQALSDLTKAKADSSSNDKSGQRQIYVAALPGTFVYPTKPLAFIGVLADRQADDGDEDVDEEIEKLQKAFSVDDERSFDQDPRFGLSVLSEIASRALSPALNDPGTAIDVIGRAVRVLAAWAKGAAHYADDDEGEAELEHPNVWVPDLKSADLFDDVFSPIARDGAALIEVHVRLQKALLALAQTGNESFRSSAIRHSNLALKRAEMAMTLKEDLTLLSELVDEVSANAAG